MSGRSFAMLTSFPPTACGIATFSAALAAGLIVNGASVDIVRCGDPPALEDALVVASMPDSTASRVDAAISALNNADVAIVQHEYGLFDGADGASVLEVLAGVTVPLVVVAHTVVRSPTESQRLVLAQVCDAAEVVVVMTESARVGLIERFDVAPHKIVLIPHGATIPALDDDEKPRVENRSPQILTWGLLGPGKGIEWAIDAFAMLTYLRPRPRYLVAGATHPKVLAHSGDAYRNMLRRRAWSSLAAPLVAFDDSYRDLHSLMELIRDSDLVVLPYDSADQVTSGVLVDAVAAGRPVVSTAFPHAVELLSSGAGIVVPQRDPKALAIAIRRVLTDPELAASMAAEATRLAPDLSWQAVARRYDTLACELLHLRERVGA